MHKDKAQKMKIAVGVNLFGTCPRQNLSMQSLIKCKQILGDSIDIFNVQFADSKNLTEHENLKTLKFLKQNSKNVCNSNRELPILREMFDCLANLDYDYFCFVNSDIIVVPKFFEEIFENEHEAYVASRLDIKGDITDLNFSITDKKNSIKITLFDQEATKKATVINYNVWGFDGFTIKSKWWKNNRLLFPENIYSIAYWDTLYATLLLKNANTYIQNKNPTLFHIFHQENIPVSSAASIELDYNLDTFSKRHSEDWDLWHRFLLEILVKRDRDNNYLYPLPNEVELQKAYFENTF